ncbi:MAG TPA: hypothetical protein PKD64_16840 [Pirellulaceae bacterium]|nr:hypothetical protein [Pirellulaceae bacterium]HMO93855.1 hypothetical protein [Pirellulaceae bacterium]
MNDMESSICEQLLKQIQDTNGNERYQAIQEYKSFLEAVLLRKSVDQPQGAS